MDFIIDSTINNVFVIDGSINHSGRSYDNGHSSFEGSADMSLAPVFNAGRLTVPSALNYAGVITLINNGGQTITKIDNTSAAHVIRYVVETGLSQTFSHTAIGVAAGDDLVSDAAAANVVVGRVNGGDFIEYERTGSLNVRTNAAIMA